MKKVMLLSVFFLTGVVTHSQGQLSEISAYNEDDYKLNQVVLAGNWEVRTDQAKHILTIGDKKIRCILDKNRQTLFNSVNANYQYRLAIGRCGDLHIIKNNIRAENSTLTANNKLDLRSSFTDPDFIEPVIGVIVSNTSPMANVDLG